LLTLRSLCCYLAANAGVKPGKALAAGCSAKQMIDTKIHPTCQQKIRDSPAVQSKQLLKDNQKVLLHCKEHRRKSRPVNFQGSCGGSTQFPDAALPLANGTSMRSPAGKVIAEYGK
jgi:hypothetical protein